MIPWYLPMSVYLITLFSPLPAIAPDFSQNLLKTQTLARQGGDVLIECKPRMSPRGVISWRKGKEALRESYRYVRARPLVACSLFFVCPFDISDDRAAGRRPRGFNMAQFELHNMLCAPLSTHVLPRFSLFPETLLYSAVPDCAQHQFLHCLLNVIGHSWTAAGLDRCADPSAH